MPRLTPGGEGSPPGSGRYVTVTGPPDAATAAGGEFMWSSMKGLASPALSGYRQGWATS
jgi:hypothetical protein